MNKDEDNVDNAEHSRDKPDWFEEQEPIGQDQWYLAKMREGGNGQR